MELLTLKIIILTLSGIIRLFFGMLPIVVMKCLSNKFRESKLKTVISILMFFGGGVLLATCFLHMMPEVRESFKTALPQTEFPVAEIIFIGGFFIVYMLEDIIHFVIDRRRGHKKLKQKKGAGGSDHNSLDEKGFPANINGAYQSTGDITAATKETNPFPPRRPSNLETNNRHPIRSSYPGEIIPVGGVNVLPRLARPTDYNLHVTHNNMKNDPAMPFGAEKFSYVDPDWWRDTVIANSQMNLLSTSSFSVASVGQETGGKDVIDSHRPHPHHNGSDDEETSIAGSIRNLLIVIAISFHGIFEGLAIGIQPTAKDLWYLFLAVSLHECTILFCIGVELISSKTRVFRMITYILVVSLVSPIGIAIGIVVSEKSFEDAVVHALVVGSFQASKSSYFMLT
ncbi:unnamed protein product [Allacma fusca]|uniref:Uncharacterized protein n=1 Tax=Allacma fusca TaxID=39272 RepID=A0A8J2KKD2_9HEXA|nr:unnamed protein product [Allacma fusca]